MFEALNDLPIHWSAKQLPFAFVAIITLIFSRVFALRLKHKITNSVPDAYLAEDRATDIINFTLDGISRTSFALTPLVAMPVFFFDLLTKTLPDWIKLTGLVVMAVLIVGSVIMVDHQAPPTLQTDTWLRLRRSTWLDVMAILFNIVLAILSAIESPAPTP